MRTRLGPFLALLILSTVRCSSSTEPEADMCLLERADLEAAITTSLDGWDRDADFTVLLEEGCS